MGHRLQAAVGAPAAGLIGLLAMVGCSSSASAPNGVASPDSDVAASASVSGANRPTPVEDASVARDASLVEDASVVEDHRRLAPDAGAGQPEPGSSDDDMTGNTTGDDDITAGDAAPNGQAPSDAGPAEVDAEIDAGPSDASVEAGCQQAGDLACDGRCDSQDRMDGPDCDGACSLDDGPDGVDCDGVCGVTDAPSGPDCDGACGAADADSSPDCDGSCAAGDSHQGPDCDDACHPGELGPDCDGTCESVDSATGADCDGVCALSDAHDGPDCDGACGPTDTADGPDCDGACGPADATGGPDCDGRCGVRDAEDGPDCDGVCAAGDLGADCDARCDSPDAATGGDCDGACGLYDAADGPDCDGDCGPADAADGPDCLDPCTVTPTLPGCGDPDGGAGDPDWSASPAIPAVSVECPVWQTGVITFMGLSGIRIEAGSRAAGSTAPMVFYWHGTGSFAEEYTLLAEPVRQGVVEEGGILVSFQGTTGGDLLSGTATFGAGDFALTDQLVACAVRDHDIDPRRIFTTGCSAGGLFSAAMAAARSTYIAAAAPNSGGWTFPVGFASDYTPALMTVHGAAGVDVVIVDFSLTSATADEAFQTRGGFVIDCDHGGAHCEGAALAGDIWRFFKAHPYGADPDPWTDGLPSDFDDSCTIF